MKTTKRRYGKYNFLHFLIFMLFDVSKCVVYLLCCFSYYYFFFSYYTPVCIGYNNRFKKTYNT